MKWTAAIIGFLTVALVFAGTRTTNAVAAPVRKTWEYRVVGLAEYAEFKFKNAQALSVEEGRADDNRLILPGYGESSRLDAALRQRFLNLLADQEWELVTMNESEMIFQRARTSR